MDSANLDETRPTSPQPGEDSLHDTAPTPVEAEHSTNPEAEAGITQPTPVEGEPAASPGPEAGVTQPTSVETEVSPIVEDTASIPVMPQEDFPPDSDQPPGEGSSHEHKGRRTWVLWSILGVLLLALIAGGSALAGYNSAIDERTQHQSTQVAGEAANQYILAQQDIATGNFDRARQRLEYVIQLDPNYPNAADQLASVLLQQRITATPTLAPTATLVPTQDFRSRDELFAQAQSFLVGREWTKAMDALLLLRKNFPDFNAVQVDDMLFVALRNRGIDKIALDHDLEGGNYDLTLAERFGPLDAEARNWRDWAELYIRGASYWGVDWGQSVNYFSQLAPAAPNLSDASGWTASNRYLEALLGYGDWLAARGQWCDAQQQYDMYMSLMASSQVEPTAVYASDQCASGAGAAVTPGGDTPTPGTPTDTPLPPTPETPQPPTTPYP